jgi:hypothetical protein
MNTEAFLKAYNESRNGTDQFHFNPLYRNFLYSDGVKECAEAGCYWLLDILGTEMPAVFKQQSGMVIINVTVKDSVANIVGGFQDDSIEYTKRVEFTDMPEGRWSFLISNDGSSKLFCILLSEY